MYELVSWFQEKYPDLVEIMKLSNHHGDSLNPYHLESDIFTHTMMVCKQAEHMPYEVRIAALLHDIGKPDVRKVKESNGHVTFYNHDAISAFKSLDILRELKLDKWQIRDIFYTIALHTQIFKQDENQLKSTCKNLEDIHNYLYMLGMADHGGRFTSTDAKDIVLTYEPPVMEEYTPKDKKVTLLCGLPCSGKSTYRSVNDFDFEICRDDILLANYPANTYNESFKIADQKHVDKLLQNKLQKAKDYDNIVIDMTHMSKKSRRKTLSHFGDEFEKRCVLFLTPLNEILARNDIRMMETGKNIPTDVFMRMMSSFYPPTYEQFDHIEYII